VMMVNKITYKEYLEALERVKAFHKQLNNEVLNARKDLITLKNSPVEETIFSLIEGKANNRIIFALRSFLESEVCYQKIPFASAADVPVVFFIEKYTLSQLRGIRGLGRNSLILINEILVHAGHNTMR